MRGRRIPGVNGSLPSILAVAALVAIAVLRWLPATLIAAGVAVAALVVYRIHFGPMRRAGIDEVGAVFACREAKTHARGARPAPALEKRRG